MIVSVLTFLLVATCNKDKEDESFILKNIQVDLPSHKLETYTTTGQSDCLVVFESGLGDGHSIWSEKNIIKDIHKLADILLYDRAGYENSTAGPAPRNIQTLSSELDSVITRLANGRKVILVGHSLGGLIIRDYAIKNKSKVAALLFIDPTHEDYNKPTQSIEDELVNLFTEAYGPDFGATMEIREIIEDIAYASTLTDLPDVPVAVLTSMKADANNNQSDSLYVASRTIWFEAHESLGIGVNDFTHSSTIKSGHYIMREEPELVVECLESLLLKIR